MEILLLIILAGAVRALGSLFSSPHSRPRSSHREDQRRRLMAAAASQQWQEASRRNQQRVHQRWRR
jgi:hypothetical protein